MRFDTEGLLWHEAPRAGNRRDNTPRPLPPTPETDWVLPEGFEAFPDLRNHGAIAFDVEAKDPELATKGPGYVRGDAYICGVAVATEAGFKQYYPVAHEIGPNLPPKVVFGWLKEQLERPGQIKMGANLLYDLEALHYSGINVAGPFYDVQVAEPLLDENRLKYDLDTIARIRVGRGKKQSIMLKWLRDAFGDDETNIKKFIYRAPPAIAGPYAEEDVALPLEVFAEQKRLLEDQGLWDLFLLEGRLIPLLLKMRLRGVPIDVAHAEQLSGVMEAKYKDGLAEIKRLTGHSADVWAADSLARIYDSLGVDYPRTAKRTNKKGTEIGGRPSFTKKWLLHNRHPVSELIRDVRNADKMKGTFIDGYLINGHVNGRVYCQFNQLRSDEGGTVSGRFSSSKPNLQNIPVRTKEGKLIRQAFIAEAGRSWWKFDWSQLEYRILAHYAAATGMNGIQPVIDAYNNDPKTDYHQAVADLTGLPRGDAKNLNFGLAYGMGVDHLCEDLGVDRAEGERILGIYHSRAPFLKELMALAGRQAQRNGFVKTILGRRRRFSAWERRGEVYQEMHMRHILQDHELKRHGWSDDDIENHDLHFPDNPDYAKALERAGYRRAFLHKAVNSLTQGSNADIIKKAMVESYEAGIYDEIGVPYLTVHDELDGDYDPSIPSHVEAVAALKNLMDSVVKLRVPLLAELKTGPNWGVLE